MKRTIYLAYGSNLNLEQMAQRCPTAKVLGTAVLTGYRLLFRGNSGGAVATVEPCEDSNVPVLLWRLEAADEAALDRYEGFPYFYRKETVTVEINGKSVKAMVYIMNEGRPLGMPGLYYYDTIAEGYCSAGFDLKILKKAARISAPKRPTSRHKLDKK